MHHNARPHVARHAAQFIQDNHITILPWPAQLPDLNQIKHARDMIQRRVLHENPEFQNQEQLFVALNAAWITIPQEDLDNLILSMPISCRAVINFRGGPTRY